MKTILAAALMMVAAGVAFSQIISPNQPGIKVTGGNNIAVSWTQSQYGTSSEVQLWYADGGNRKTPVLQINGATGGAATFTNLRPSGYYVVVLSEQTRRGFTSEAVTIP